MARNEKRVSLGWASSSVVTAEFQFSINSIILNRRDNIEHIICSPSSYLSMNRNLIIESFLNTESEWLFFFDTDISIEVEDFDKILDAADPKKYPVMGGKYFLVLVDNWEKEAIVRVSAQKEKNTWLREYPQDTIVSNLWSMGFGYVLIHRSVFEKIQDKNPGVRYPWCKDGYDDVTGNIYGEDDYFWEQVRNCGINISLHTGASSKHVRKLPVTEKDFLTEENIRLGILFT